MGPGRVVVASCVLFAFYVLLAGSFSVTELLAGLGSVAVVTVFVVVVHRGEHRRLRIRPPVRVPLRTAWSLLPDTIRVGRVLCRAIVRRPQGRLGTILPLPFDHGAEQAEDAGRRGLVTLAASLAPNAFVLAMPRGCDRLVMHRLAPSPPPTDRRWPS